MKLISVLNRFFLHEDESEIHVSDKVWFYGFYATAFTIVAIVLLSKCS